MESINDTVLAADPPKVLFYPVHDTDRVDGEKPADDSYTYLSNLQHRMIRSNTPMCAPVVLMGTGNQIGNHTSYSVYLSLYISDIAGAENRIPKIACKKSLYNLTDENEVIIAESVVLICVTFSDDFSPVATEPTGDPSDLHLPYIYDVFQFEGICSVLNESPEPKGIYVVYDGAIPPPRNEDGQIYKCSFEKLSPPTTDSIKQTGRGTYVIVPTTSR